MNDSIFILVFNNNTGWCKNHNDWRASTVYSKFPTVEEILDHSCLDSSDSNDVEMAKKLVETNGLAHRFIYENDELAFFECMIIKRKFGENLDLSELLISGYADMSEDRQIQYKKK